MANTQDKEPRAAGVAHAPTAAAGGRSGSSGAAAAGVKAGPVLPWMRVPITIESGTGVPIEGVLGMDKRLVPVLLNEFSFTELFPVQAAVWQHSAGGRSTAHDLCVAAPTGSGKTLAYALPVVNALADTTAHKHFRSLGRLQALVVLPTRDLAAQVYDVFRPLCEAVGLNAVLAAARTSEAAEAAQLLGTAAAATSGGGSGDVGGGGGGGSHRHLHRAAPGGMAGAAHGGGGGIGSGSGAGGGGGAGCGWGADVVVATPGRLMAHLSGTPGFTLEHLRFLVVDETDRLLRQSYQEWLPRVLAQLSPQHAALQQHLHVLAQHGLDIAGGSSSSSGSSSHGGGGGAAGHFAALWPGASTGTALPYSVPRVVKIVVSATLTRDPAKLQRLALHHPRYVATAGSAGAAGGGGGQGSGSGGGGSAAAAAAARYSLPRSLSEYRLLCSAARKPLALLALLADASAAGESVIVFTSSLEMTHKLYLMLSAVPELAGQVVEYSSHVTAKERATGLERFRKGGAKVLVASDAMTRGMDVDCVQAVINYDAPVYAKTYVHRAGRTARAGKSGRVVTLLRDEDMRHFKAMIRKADNNFVRELKLPAERVESFRPALAGALQQLEALLAAEKRADAVTAAELLKQQQQQQAQQQQRQEQKQKQQQQDAGKAQNAAAEKEQEGEADRRAEDEGEQGDADDAADGEEAHVSERARAQQKRGREDNGVVPGRKRRGGTHKRPADTADAGQQVADDEGGGNVQKGKRKRRREAGQG
ncbi:hypothetical protein HYH02_004925 [Chlamydomonas schloesseri]|uniref:ATP-dependent RNA helicase n=1 Tax=Chlamydomonas schloesseri TaxID=2026947 RepID=A0A835WNE8_9CHLO|nr:hypothetical protein HYH02_004925 [Chlamydomonas schloesseri]|eukprot:KAG2450423.1 hypothetical protein HYH02_004925 [Chlamydomonas schloesseri]